MACSQQPRVSEAPPMEPGLGTPGEGGEIAKITNKLILSASTFTEARDRHGRCTGFGGGR
jgi:hypothetical protein